VVEMVDALIFRSLARPDFALLAMWLEAPHVAPWWPDPSDLASLERTYGPVVDGIEATQVFIVEFDGRPIGLIQRYRLPDYPEWERALAPAGVSGNLAGIDYLIGEASQIGHGLGPAIIGAFVERTFAEEPGIAGVAVAVQQANRRSWRALEKAGFDRHWAGLLDSDDPSDAGPSYVYLRRRPPPSAAS